VRTALCWQFYIGMLANCIICRNWKLHDGSFFSPCFPTLELVRVIVKAIERIWGYLRASPELLSRAGKSQSESM